MSLGSLSKFSKLCTIIFPYGLHNLTAANNIFFNTSPRVVILRNLNKQHGELPVLYKMDSHLGWGLLVLMYCCPLKEYWFPPLFISTEAI
jgi:hypothetical protein